MATGQIFRIAGPVVTATGIRPRMNDVVLVGNERLMGEVIRIEGERTVVQVYEETIGLRPGEPVEETGAPLAVELGPGLLSSIYDGVQRPLPVLVEKSGEYISRGLTAPGLSRSAQWHFVPTLKRGDAVAPGAVIGSVQETKHFSHRILVPAGISGKVADIREGTFNVEAVVCILEGGSTISMMQRWPVRVPRPVRDKLPPEFPMVTGQRVLDTFFPLAKGGTAAIPGGFGTGKTVTQHQLAKWSDADVVVYVGCGERGNEMTEVLEAFPRLLDPRTGAPLMQRTVLIANTSNMPVAAREASVYTGITIAEYFRDMGYDVALMADSTSRWAEAMREISSRLEEMPGEEGYPAYLSSRLAEFYERAGRVKALSGKEGSISTIGAVSPPGGDFSEPVTQGTLRFVKVFWALDTKLRERRHFPSINWLTSYSLYADKLEDWFTKNVKSDWRALSAWAMGVLQREAELQEVVQLVGSDALPEEQRLLLVVARMIREYFLQQNAYHDVDTFCPMQRQYALLNAIRRFGGLGEKAVKLGVPVQQVSSLQSRERLSKAKYEKDADDEIARTVAQMEDEFRKMEVIQ
ncbi:MAG: V-type ATP synthase subunit A [Euryarchaeota archaeon]|nr:V-type ATP synthase subunit A [Euryarchaeota archaeon]